jgi:hypothetical protein
VLVAPAPPLASDVFPDKLTDATEFTNSVFI